MANVAMAVRKTCRCCGEDKPLDAFHIQRSGLHGRRATCAVCRQRESYGKKYRWRNIRLRYGLTKEQYEAMGSSCQICGYVPDGEGERALAVDHDHVTGKVRGLLCASCNRALGYMRDNPVFLRAAADYIETTRER